MVRQTRLITSGRLNKTLALNEKRTRLVAMLERELHKVLRPMGKKRQQSGEKVMKGIEELIGRLDAQEIKTKAFAKKDEITKELKKQVKKLKKLDVKLNDAAPIVEQVRDNVNGAIHRVQDLEMMEFARGKISDTKNQVFTLLNIPSQTDLDNLVRKISTLEKKVNSLNKTTSKRK